MSGGHRDWGENNYCQCQWEVYRKWFYATLNGLPKAFGRDRKPMI